MTKPMTVTPHIVQAFITGGWAVQACDTRDQAVALFDRLRAVTTRRIERLENGRVVEISGAGPSTALPEAEAA